MNADVLSNCLEQAIPIVREAGKLLHDRVCSSSIQEKGKTDFVTAVDIVTMAQLSYGLRILSGLTRIFRSTKTP